MKKFLLTAACIFALQVINAQINTETATDSTQLAGLVSTPKPKKGSVKIDLSNRSNDHLMLQYGVANWAGTNDTINPGGFSRFFNFYIMLDKPFKTNPKLSVGLGIGIGSDNIFFKNTYVDLTSTKASLPFKNVDSLDHFKKFKLTTMFLEAPIELRYSSDPANNGKSIKAALGVKVGTLLKAYTKGKTLLDKNDNEINSFIEKQYNKRFFNSIRLAGTARIGYGIFSLFGSYQITSFFKEGAGPSEIRPYNIGICLSGL